MSAGTVMAIEDLVSVTSLGISVLAGRDGLRREVLWAHSCEMPEPEQWLGPHELLMTVGLCVPAKPADQVDFIGRLDEAGLAGLMIGDHETAPPVSDAMLAEADARSFPVLLAASRTPYAAVARHVAAATSSSQILQVLRLSKVYQIAASADDDTEGLVRQLAALLRIGLRIEDRLTGITILTAELPADGASVAPERSYQLHGAHPADLFIAEYPGEALDSFLLVHLMKVLEVNVDRMLAAAALRAEASALALTRLLVESHTAEVERMLHGYPAVDGFHMVAIDAERAAWLRRAATLRQLPVLIGGGRSGGSALIPRVAVADLREITERAGIRVAVSSMFTDYQDARAAVDEAKRVLETAAFSGRLWSEFEGSTIAVLTRSHREAEEIVSGVLGPLAATTPAMTKLRDTLFAYLRNDRHWQETAHELGVHRQTLSYRLNRIQEETGLSVTGSADLASLWIAYQAWESLTRARP